MGSELAASQLYQPEQHFSVSLEIMMMTRLVQPFIFLAAFYSAMANANDYEVSVSFATGPDQPTRIVLTDQYCMGKVPDVTNLKEGKAKLDVETNGGFFTKCGWVHSSATFEVQNDQKEKKLVFEFYKYAGIYPILKVLWPTNVNCNGLELFLACGPL